MISTFFTHFHQAHKRKQAAKKKKNNKRAIADHAGVHGFGAMGTSADGLDGRDETGEIERPTTVSSNDTFEHPRPLADTFWGGMV